MPREQGVALEELSLKTMQGLCPDIDAGIFSVLAPEKAVTCRNSVGGTAPAQVRASVQRARQIFNLKD